jgi:hypothetical protein
VRRREILDSEVGERLNEPILRAVDDGLEILGSESAKTAFYYQVQKRAKIKREEIPFRLESFHRALVDLFGKGALILERIFARNLYDKLNLCFEKQDGWNIVDYVRQAEAALNGTKVQN